MSAFSICAVPNAAHHRRGHVGIFAAATGSAPRSTDTTRSAGGRSRRRVHVEVRAQVRLLLGHRLEQQPLLRREVAVHGAERDVGRGRDVAHLHRVEATLGRELQASRRAPAAGAAAWLRASAASGAVSGSGTRGDHERNWNRFLILTSKRPTPTRARDCRREVDAPAMELLELADKLFTGELPIEAHHPFASSGQMAEVQPGLAFVDAFANSAAVDTADGLVVVDTSGVFHAAGGARHRCAAWSPSPPRTPRSSPTATSTTSSASTSTRKRRAPTAGRRRASSRTRRSPARFERYRMTAGYNAVINQRQFQAPGLCVADASTATPTRPTATRSSIDGRRRGVRAAPRPRRDRRRHVGVVRRARRCSARATCSSGRRRTAATRRRCSATRATGRSRSARWLALEPEVLLPGHGLPIVGADRVRQRADRNRRAARVARRADARADERGRAPRRHRARGARARAPARTPYLQPVYDEPEFVVRNLWRLYGGWYDGDPAHLKPAPGRRARARDRRARRRRGPARRAGRSSSRPPATCASPATSPSWPRRPRPTTPACTRPGPRCSAPGPATRRRRCRRAIFAWAEHESSQKSLEPEV